MVITAIWMVLFPAFPTSPLSPNFYARSCHLRRKHTYQWASPDKWNGSHQATHWFAQQWMNWSTSFNVFQCKLWKGCGIALGLAKGVSLQMLAFEVEDVNGEANVLEVRVFLNHFGKWDNKCLIAVVVVFNKHKNDEASPNMIWGECKAKWPVFRWGVVLQEWNII